MQGVGVDRLFETGAHFAQVKSRRHPSMKNFVLGAKANLEIFDLKRTDEQLAAAKGVMAALARDGKLVLIVGGKREASDQVREAGLRIGVPFVAGRWLGGTVSNFTEIKKRIDRLADLSAKRDSGELSKLYTKLERIRIDREIAKLTERLSGLALLSRKPDLMVIVDTKHEAHATRAIVDEAPVALVTSAWHMPRAMALFRAAGVNVVPCPTDFQARPNTDFRWTDWTFDISGLDRTTFAVHEYLGLWWLRLRRKI